MDFRRVTRSMAQTIPAVITSGQGCKEDANIDRFHSRTAGMLYFFRPCGVRLAHWEMYTAESLSQVFLSLMDLSQLSPDKIRGIVYDRACDLHPFIVRLAEEGNEAARAMMDLVYIVDIFHAEKHTMPKCVLGNPQCKYHPDLPIFEPVRKMNTEIAEQSFRRINPFKYITRRMTYGRMMLYLKFLDHFMNERLASTV